ncbi:MAG: DNA topoisomerase VI subunit B [Nanoarchaeota archaeon]
MSEEQATLAEKSGETVHASELAKNQRDIGVAEFFARNRHLLGFDNKIKALMTTIKEAVDNALDACEEANILPEITVEIIDMSDDRYRVIIEDNGPGIVKRQIPKIFAKLLYGSKFHQLKMSRGQQGIGISAAVMYGQLTTGRPAKIMSKTDAKQSAHVYELKIDTRKNEPNIVSDEKVEWEKDHGTRIEIDLEATYQRGARSIDEYLKQTAIVNPHVTIIYTNPKAEQFIFSRAVEKKPEIAEAIKPHPYGVELGVLMSMLHETKTKTLQQFLTTEFVRVGANTAKEICANGRLDPKMKPQQLTRDSAEHLIKGIKQTKIMAPPTDCIASIGSELLEKGLKKEINAEFYATTTRSPAVYRGNPFIIEAGIAYGGDQSADALANILRFANRVPLLFQQGACAATKAIQQTNWRNYNLQQSRSSLPSGPITIAIAINSVWVPFTSESKEAIAHYPEILKEMKLALQEVGRDLGSYLRKKKRVKHELKKRSYIEKYIPHVADALKELLELEQSKRDDIEDHLCVILEHERGKMENMEFDPTKNTEYDEEFAKMGGSYDDTDDEYEDEE